MHAFNAHVLSYGAVPVTNLSATDRVEIRKARQKLNEKLSRPVLCYTCDDTSTDRHEKELRCPKNDPGVSRGVMVAMRVASSGNPKHRAQLAIVSARRIHGTDFRHDHGQLNGARQLEVYGDTVRKYNGRPGKVEVVKRRIDVAAHVVTQTLRSRHANIAALDQNVQNCSFFGTRIKPPTILKSQSSWVICKRNILNVFERIQREYATYQGSTLFLD